MSEHSAGFAAVVFLIERSYHGKYCSRSYWALRIKPRLMRKEPAASCITDFISNDLGLKELVDGCF